MYYNYICIQQQLDAYKEDYYLEHIEKNKIKHELEQLKHHLEVARTENEHASQKVVLSQIVIVIYVILMYL